jgi:hypothetical protein
MKPKEEARFRCKNVQHKSISASWFAVSAYVKNILLMELFRVMRGELFELRHIT